MGMRKVRLPWCLVGCVMPKVQSPDCLTCAGALILPGRLFPLVLIMQASPVHSYPGVSFMECSGSYFEISSEEQAVCCKIK